MPYIPQLVRYKYKKKPRSQQWYGSLYLKGDEGGMARKLNAQNMDFEKVGIHGWSGWVWFDEDDTRIHTLERVGTPNVNGYRIVKTKSGNNHLLSIQEMTTYSATVFVYPAGFDVTKPHYIYTGFNGLSDTSVETWCYIDEREIRTKQTNIDWSKAVAVSNPTVIVGSDYPVETLLGHINDIGFYKKRLTVNEIFRNRLKRNFKHAVSYWRCDENGGSTIKDLVGSNDLTISAPGVLKIANQSWPPLPGVGLDPTTLNLVDPNMSFNYGNQAQSGTGYYNEAETATHLDFMWEVGARELRIPFANVTFADGLAVTKLLLLQAKARGFRIIAVTGARPATDANFATVKADNMLLAQWCVDNNMDEFMQFNEISYRETTYHVLTNTIDKELEMYTDLRAEFPDLVISTAIAQSSLDYLGAPNGYIARAADINAAGLIPYYNAYGDADLGFLGSFEQWKTRILDLRAVFPDMRLSEFNQNADIPGTDTQRKEQIDRMVQWLIAQDMGSFFHTFYWPIEEKWALLKANDQYRIWYEVLLKNR